MKKITALFLHISFALFANAQSSTVVGFKPISSAVKVPLSIYFFPDTTSVITLDDLASSSLFDNANIPAEKAFSLTDKNKNKEVTYQELINALSKDLFYIQIKSFHIKYYLMYLDKNKDGYISDESDVKLSSDGIALIEALDHKKYAYTCGETNYDNEFKVRSTGNCRKNGKIFISELINANEEKKIWIGAKIYWKN